MKIKAPVLAESTEAVTDELLRELKRVGKECGKADWDGYDALPVLRETLDFAEVVVRSLPHELPPAEVGADARGFVRLEWFRSPRKVIVVAIHPDRVIHHAAILGNERTWGTVDFEGAIPSDVLTRIGRVVFE